MAKKRERTARRAMERDAEKLARARERVAATEPGGAPERPIELSSASQVEGRATSLRCLRCEGELKLREHRAIVHPVGGSLREVELRCAPCGHPRLVWFRVGPVLN